MSLDRVKGRGDVAVRKLGHEQPFAGKAGVHRYDYPTDFTAHLGGTWSNPGPALTPVTGDVTVAAPKSPGTPLAERPRPAAGPEPTWQDGEPEPHERDGELAAGAELDSQLPTPGQRRTAADMLGAGPAHTWRERLKTPFIGRIPPKFDEHRGHWLRRNAGRTQEPGEHALNERNAGLGALEVFTSPEARMARFDRAVLHEDRSELKSHSHGALLGTRERHGDLSLRTRLGNPTVVEVDEQHWFADKSSAETERATDEEKTWRARFRAALTLFIPVNPFFTSGATVGGELSYTRGSGSADAGKAKSSDAAGHHERGYLVRYDATHTLRTSVRRHWEDVFHKVRGGTARTATKSLRQPGYAEVWVPAGSIDQVGELTEADLAKLRPEDAERYRAARGTGEPDAEPREVPAVRPPDDVGRGRGDVTAHRPEAGRELAEGISRELDTWAREHGQVVSSPTRVLAAVQRAMRLAGTSDRSAIQRRFDELNDGLMRSSVWPVLGSRLADPALREIVSGGLPILVVSDHPVGRLEQLVVVSGRPSGGRYHDTIGKPTDPGGAERSSGHELVRKAGRHDTRGFLASFAASGVVYPRGSGSPASLISPGGSATYNAVRRPERVHEHTAGVLAGLKGPSHRFVHDLDAELWVFPQASPGTYRKLMPDWASALNAPEFSRPWTAEFTVPDALRSTVPEAETIPLDAPAPGPLAVHAPLDRRRDAAVFSPNAVVHVGRFAAPNLHAAARTLILGGAGRDRPGMKPSDAYSLLTELHVDKLRNHLREASSGGRSIEFKTGPLSGVTVSVDLAQRELLQVLEGSLKPSEVDEVIAKWAAERGLSAAPALSIDFREPYVDESKIPPSQQVGEMAADLGQAARKRSAEVSSKRTGDGTEHRTMYLAAVVPKWTLEPRYRGADNPAEWSEPLTTGADQPIPVLVDRQGVLDLGFQVPGEADGGLSRIEELPEDEEVPSDEETLPEATPSAWTEDLPDLGADLPDLGADLPDLTSDLPDLEVDPPTGVPPSSEPERPQAPPVRESTPTAPGARPTPEDPAWRSARVHPVSADGYAPRFEVRRFSSDGAEFLAASLRLGLEPGPGVRPEQVDAAHRALREAAERRLGGAVLPSGDFAGAGFALDVARDDQAPHTGFTVVDGPAREGEWSLDSSGDELLDQVLQQMGAPPADGDLAGPRQLAGIAAAIEANVPIHPDPRLREEHPALIAGYDVAEYDAARAMAKEVPVDADLTLPFSAAGHGPRARFDVRRFEVGGERVVEATLRLDLDPVGRAPRRPTRSGARPCTG
ncbi:hypothetical protein [Saccharopolyspora sp. CA-218241]|uniref:hypothetical protein n=1 Tax=Saccharopolyspora sp. CA-218241 TaxID=3240027 RepID=UPI003D974676